MNINYLNVLIACSLTCLTLVGCGGRVQQATLGDLKYTEKKSKGSNIEPLTKDEVRREYEELISEVQDSVLKEQISRRVANMYMAEGEEGQLKAQSNKNHYSDAIKSYREILDKYPDSPENADLYYQLAKAYDMQGDIDEALKMMTLLAQKHPSYPELAEVYFRMGDIYFNQNKYSASQQAYTKVLNSNRSDLHLNASYMLGWSYYKQQKHSKAFNMFTQVLIEVMGGRDDYEQLSKTEKPFVDDSINSISLTVARSEGVEMIQNSPALKDKPYVWRIYKDLGEYYLEKERYDDAADTYRVFVDNYKDTEWAPKLHIQLIEGYKTGGFLVRSLEEKEVFVNYYGISSGALRNEFKPTLKTYITQISKSYHSEAQELEKKIDQMREGGVADNNAKLVENEKLMVGAYEKASYFYGEYLDTFPQDPDNGEIYFLKAEANFATSRYDLAIKDYEKVAYELNDSTRAKHGKDAGYAVIVAHENILKGDDLAELDEQQWQEKTVASMLKFAEVYGSDERAPSVMASAAERLFNMNQLERAMQVAEALIAKGNRLDPALKKSAYSIVANSQFKLNNHQNALDSYIRQRALADKSSVEYRNISERIANALYKNYETVLAGGDKKAAIDELIKIKELAPESKIRTTAQYNAAVMMLELKMWQRAVGEFEQMSRLFPQHELAKEFPRKTAFAYEKLERWPAAANQYLLLANNDPDPSVRQEALFLAAELFEKAEQRNNAINTFKRYSSDYREPFAKRIEAQYRLASNYEKNSDWGSQSYWLNQLIQGDQQAGANRTERSQWLAAWSRMKFADYTAKQFEQLPITLPLDKSLPRKNDALTQAIDSYQAAANYNILEFVSMANYKIAGLYQTFADDLLAAPVPKEFSAADKEMYQALIAEQALPFVDLAREMHLTNVDLVWDRGLFTSWIDKSFTKMRTLNPERFSKQEYLVSYGNEIL